MKCKVCGCEISPDAKVCRICGSPVAPDFSSLRENKQEVKPLSETAPNWNVYDFSKKKAPEDIVMQWPQFNVHKKIDPNQADAQITAAMAAKTPVSIMKNDATEGFVSSATRDDIDAFSRPFEEPPVPSTRRYQYTQPVFGGWTMPEQKTMSDMPLWYSQPVSINTQPPVQAVPVIQVPVQFSPSGGLEQRFTASGILKTEPLEGYGVNSFGNQGNVPAMAAQEEKKAAGPYPDKTEAVKTDAVKTDAVNAEAAAAPESTASAAPESTAVAGQQSVKTAASPESTAAAALESTAAAAPEAFAGLSSAAEKSAAYFKSNTLSPAAQKAMSLIGALEAFTAKKNTAGAADIQSSSAAAPEIKTDALQTAKELTEQEAWDELMGSVIKPTAEAQSEIKSESGTEAQVADNSEVMTVTEPEPAAETEAEVLPETEAEIPPETEAEVLPESEAEIPPETEAEVLPESEAEALSEKEPEAQPEIKSETGTETLSDIKTEPVTAADEEEYSEFNLEAILSGAAGGHAEETQETSGEDWLDQLVKPMRSEAAPDQTKFHTFLSKNAEFQNLLNQEYERAKNIDKDLSRTSIMGAVSTPISQLETLDAEDLSSFENMLKAGTRDSDVTDATIPINLSKIRASAEAFPDDILSGQQTQIFGEMPEAIKKAREAEALKKAEEEMARLEAERKAAEAAADAAKTMEGTVSGSAVSGMVSDTASGNKETVVPEGTNPLFKDISATLGNKDITATQAMNLAAVREQEALEKEGNSSSTRRLEEMAKARAAYFDEMHSLDSKEDGVSAQNASDPDEDFEEEDSERGKYRTGGGFFRFVLFVVIVLGLAFGANMMLQRFAPDSKAAEVGGDIQQVVFDFFETVGEKISAGFDKITGSATPASQVDVRALKNEVGGNLENVRHSRKLTYGESSNCGFDGIADANIVEDSKVIEDIYRRLISYNNAWVDYVSGTDNKFFDNVVKNSNAYSSAESFSMRGLVSEDFKSLVLGEVRTDGKNYYLLAEENITVKEGEKKSESNYSWVYLLKKVGDDYLVSDYKELK